MFDVNEILKDVTGLTDAQKELLQSTLTNPTIAKRLEEGQLRQSDYSRLAQEAQEVKKRATDYYQQLVEWEATKRKELVTADPNAEPNAGGGDPEYLSRDAFRQEMSKVENGAIGFIAALSKTSMKHFKEFGTILDTDAVIAKARTDGTNFEIAYDRFVQPDREAKAKVDLDERIKREREEAAKEALANISIPTGNPNINGQGLSGGQPHVLDMIADKNRSYGWKAAADAHTRDIMSGTVKRD